MGVNIYLITFPKQINLQTLCTYKLIHFETPKLFVAIAFNIILVIGSITSWDLNHLPHRSQYYILTTMLKTVYS